jgi:hypothetical protein
MSRFGLRTGAHAKLYIGLFHGSRNEVLNALSIDVCGHTSVRVTVNRNAFSCKTVLVQYRI